MARPASIVRPRHVVIAAVALLLAAGVALGVIAIHYQPLYVPFYGSCCSGSFAGPAERGQRAFVAGEVRNRGRYTIRVTGIDAPAGVEVRVGPLERYGPGGMADGRPFRPFDLGPGEWRPIALVATRPYCPSRQATEEQNFAPVTDVRVHLRVLGMPKTATGRAGGRLNVGDTCAYTGRAPDF